MLTATHKRMLCSLEENLRPEFDACLGFYGPQPWALYASHHSYNYSMGIGDAWSVKVFQSTELMNAAWHGGNLYHYGVPRVDGPTDIGGNACAHYPVPAPIEYSLYDLYLRVTPNLWSR